MATKKKIGKKVAKKKTSVKKKKVIVKKKDAKKKSVKPKNKSTKKKVTVKKKVSAKKTVPPAKKPANKTSAKKKVTVKKKVSAKKTIPPAKKLASKKTSLKRKVKRPTLKKSEKAEIKRVKVSPAKTTSTKNKTKALKANKNSSNLRLARKEPANLDPAVLKIRERLIVNKVELLKLIQASQSVERDTGDLTFSNEIDLASSLEGREMIFQLTSRDRNELKLIEEALFRINNGSYGKCESCDKKITLKRLQIMPLTSLCIECQEAAENL
jgi:DnaK suppressor protein